MTVEEARIKEARQTLDAAIMYFRNKPVGTVAAKDSSVAAENYDHCFTRDFAVSAMAFLMAGEFDVVRNFLQRTIRLQSRDKQMDCFKPSKGLMPASFKVTKHEGKEYITADFGEHSIARVAPVDSGFWWLIILRAYVKASGDMELAHRRETQDVIRLILDLCLTARFEMYPTLLVPDGCYMIDRRLGVFGYPMDVQALFFAALKAAKEMLVPEDEEYIEAVNERLGHLIFHIREYYWLDLERLNEIYRYDTEEFGLTALNKFNINPSSIPGWVSEWLPDGCGYFTGNVGPGRMDFRFFSQGNLLAILSSLANRKQANAILNLIEEQWDDLVGFMPMKLVYPALEGRDWEILTNFDQKNVPWSYHNGGNWPFTLWLLTAAAMKTGRKALAQKAMAIAEKRLPDMNWPEYFDGKNGRLVGKKSRFMQTWTIAGFLAAESMLSDPGKLDIVCFDDDPIAFACSVRVGQRYEDELDDDL